eukprot:jgi/Botrbrau1/17235/Bobra.0865s0002.1
MWDRGTQLQGNYLGCRWDRGTQLCTIWEWFRSARVYRLETLLWAVSGNGRTSTIGGYKHSVPMWLQAISAHVVTSTHCQCVTSTDAHEITNITAHTVYVHCCPRGYKHYCPCDSKHYCR